MFKYTPRQIPSRIMVIGAGGTGSRLVPMLTQFLRSITKEFNPTGWLESPTIYLVDDDVVEHKNLLRQNFIDKDVNKPKASVLAQRYGKAYGVQILPIVKRIEENTLITELCHEADPNYSGASTMFIMCVDSAKARRNILSMIEHSVRVPDRSLAPFIIDAGNENNYGQVKFFNMCTMIGNEDNIRWDRIPKMSPVVGDTPVIPYPRAFYNSLEDAPSQGSCADLDQTLAINAAMATTIMGVVQNFYYVKPFTHNEVCINLDGAGYTTFNTVQNFRSRLFHNDVRIGCASMDGRQLFSGFISATEEALAKMEQERLRAEAERRQKELEAEAERLRLEAAEAVEATEAWCVSETESTRVTSPEGAKRVKRPRKTKTLEAPSEMVPMPEAPPLEVVRR